MESELAVLALLVAGYALIAARLDRLSIGPALAFLAIGILLADDVLGPISITPRSDAVKTLAAATLTLLLFADASTVRARALERDIVPVGRLLLIGLPLTIALGTVAAVLLFPGLPPGLALLIAAVLAPTDAGLGQAVITNGAVPARIRRLLNVESGLNDGIATPFVILALALTTVESSGGPDVLSEAIRELAIGVAVGVVVGYLGGSLLRIGDGRSWTSPVSRQLFVLALALSCYLVAAAIGGSGFIAAFVGGLAFGRGSRAQEGDAVRFTELQGSVLAIGVWVAFGLTVAGRLLADLWDPAAVVYAILSLTVIRMVPVAIALTGLRFRPATIAFIGWFGPRGLASIVFLIVGLDGLAAAGVDPGPFTAVVAWTVFLSVIVHGLSAGPLAARYGRRAAGLPGGSPELEDVAEPKPSRVHWSGDIRSGPSI